MSDPAPWSTRCPEGHASLRERSGGYYCESCDKRYSGEPHDARHTEFPVAETGESLGIHERTALSELAAICEEETRSMARAHELSSGTTADRREALKRGVAQGLVERVNADANGPDWYRPTATGWRVVRPNATRDGEVPADV